MHGKVRSAASAVGFCTMKRKYGDRTACSLSGGAEQPGGRSSGGKAASARKTQRPTQRQRGRDGDHSRRVLVYAQLFDVRH